MTPLLPTRRKAVALADAIDGRRDRKAAEDAEIDALVAAVEAVRALPQVRPSDAFNDGLRTRLVAAAERELLPIQRDRRSPRGDGRPVAPLRHRVGLAAAAGALVVSGGGAGLASASAAAIPGELLYPVKRGVERVDVALAGDDGAAGRAEMDHAGTRLDEVGALLATADPTADRRVVDTLRDFTATATSGGERLVASYTATNDEADITVLHESAVAFDDVLTDLAGALPAEAADAFAAAAATVSTLDQQAGELCPDCTGGSEPVSVPTDLVAAASWQTIISPADGTGPITVGAPTSGRRGSGRAAASGCSCRASTPPSSTVPRAASRPEERHPAWTRTGCLLPVGADDPEVEVEPPDPDGTVEDSTSTVDSTVGAVVDDLLGGGTSGGGGPLDDPLGEVDDIVDDVPVSPPTLDLPPAPGG